MNMKTLNSYLIKEYNNDKKEKMITLKFSPNGISFDIQYVEPDENLATYNETEWKTIFPKGATSVNAKTEIQERFTAYVFNAYKEDLDKMEKDLTVDMLPVALRGTDENKWLNSFKEQIKSLVGFLQSDGWNISNLTAIHPADSSIINNVIITFHKSLTSNLKSIFKNIQKDSINPSDIVIYDTSETNKIAKILRCIYPRREYPEKSLYEYQAVLKYLIDCKSLTGVSLKKGKRFRPHYNNYKDAPDLYDNIKIEKIKKTAQTLSMDFSAYNKTLDNAETFEFRIGTSSKSGSVSLELEPGSYSMAQGGKVPSYILNPIKFEKSSILDSNGNFLGFNEISPDWSNSLNVINEFISSEKYKARDQFSDEHMYNICNYIIKNGYNAAISLMFGALKIGPQCAPYLMLSPNDN